jgi:hypothetical protein
LVLDLLLLAGSWEVPPSGNRIETPSNACPESFP